MHKCKNCGKEFDGKFCPECGEKFVAKDACPKCGAHHEPNAKFCSECGARLDGKKNCPKCGALMEANSAFCPECGARLDGSKPKKAGGMTTREKVKFGFYLSGIICVLLSGLMGLVFAFVTGYAVQSGNVVGGGTMLYHFFGDAYKSIDSTVETIKTIFGLSSIGSAREFAIYFPIVLGTVISAVGLLGVVALTALTAFNAYKKFYKKQEANVVAPAVATYLTFATLATLLLVLVGMDVDGLDISGEGFSGKMVFSTPTLAGLITGGILCGAGLLIIAGVNYKKFIGFVPTVKTVTAVSVSVLFVVVIALLALPVAAISGGGETAAVSPFNWLMTMLLVVEEDEQFFEILAYAIVSGIAAIALTVIAGVNLFRKVPPISEGENKSNIVLGAVSVGLAVVLLTFVILMVNWISDFLNTAAAGIVGIDASEALGGYFAVPITVLVMSVLAFGAELAGKIVLIVKKPVAVKSEAAEEPAQTEEAQAE